MQDLRNHEIKQIQSIIQRSHCKGMGKGQEGGQPPLWSHLGNGLGPGRRAVTR